MNYSHRNFGIGRWLCIVTDDVMHEVNMISGNVVSKTADGVMIAVENVVGPNHDTFFHYRDIDEIIAH